MQEFQKTQTGKGSQAVGDAKICMKKNAIRSPALRRGKLGGGEGAGGESRERGMGWAEERLKLIYP